MRRSYHVRGARDGAAWGVLNSYDTYEVAADVASRLLKQLRQFKTDAAIEVTHAGTTVWGPYHAKGRYSPDGYLGEPREDDPPMDWASGYEGDGES